MEVPEGKHKSLPHRTVIILRKQTLNSYCNGYLMRTNKHLQSYFFTPLPSAIWSLLTLNSLFDWQQSHYGASGDLNDLLTAVTHTCTDKLIIIWPHPFTLQSMGGRSSMCVRGKGGWGVYMTHTQSVFSKQSETHPRTAGPLYHSAL